MFLKDLQRSGAVNLKIEIVPLNTTDGKKSFLKKLCLTLKVVMLSEFLVLLGIKLNKYGGNLLLIILWKRHSFLNQHFKRRCSIPWF